jgi:hypothetical protein
MPKIVKPLIEGDKFSLLTFEQTSEMKVPSGAKQSWFRCDCGQLRLMIESKVRNGYTKSCGCARTAQRQRLKKETFQITQARINTK